MGRNIVHLSIKYIGNDKDWSLLIPGKCTEWILNTHGTVVYNWMFA